MNTTATGACLDCGGDVEIWRSSDGDSDGDADQYALCDWWAYDGDEGKCVDCGLRHVVVADGKQAWLALPCVAVWTKVPGGTQR